MKWTEFYADQKRGLEAHHAATRAAQDAIDRRYEAIGEALEDGIFNLNRLLSYHRTNLEERR